MNLRRSVTTVVPFHVIAIYMLASSAVCIPREARLDGAKVSLGSYLSAVEARDYSEIRKCMTPQLRSDSDAMLAAHGRYRNLAMSTEIKLRERFGEKTARRFREGLYRTYDHMLDGVLLWTGPSGKADLDEIGLVREGNTTSVWLQDTQVGLIVVQAQGKWLVGFDETRVNGRYLSAYRSKLNVVNRTLKHILEDIRRGKIHEGNIEGILSLTELPPSMRSWDHLPSEER